MKISKGNIEFTKLQKKLKTIESTAKQHLTNLLDTLTYKICIYLFKLSTGLQ